MIGRDRDRHAGIAQRLDRRELRLAQEVVRARQQHGDRAGLRHRANPVVADVFEMIAGQRVVSRGKRRAAHVGQLLGMELHRQPERARLVEHAPGLLDREADALAEHVDRVDQMLDVEAGEPFAHRVDVLIVASLEFRRKRVRGQVRRPDGDRPLAREPPRDAQALRFVAFRESVAGLDLDRGDALGLQRDQAVEREQEETLAAGRARRRDRGPDAAAGLGDRFVARALKAELEFARALAGINQMRVAIDESRRNDRTAKVVRFGNRRRGEARSRDRSSESCRDR